MSCTPREKYGFSGLLTRTSRPPMVSVSAVSFANYAACAARPSSAMFSFMVCVPWYE